jgi:CheY-like chemotaxis protein
LPLTVVVVDDTLDFRETVRFLLLGKLSDVVTIVGEAADGAEGLAVVLRERPDLVITDLVMPRLNGVERGASLASCLKIAS